MSIKSLCTGFTLQTQDQKTVDFVRELLKRNEGVEFGLQLDTIKQFDSLPKLFHVELKENARGKSLDEVFGYAARFAKNNIDTIEFIEPTFDAGIQPVKQALRATGIGHVIQEWFRKILGKTTDEEKIEKEVAANPNWVKEMMKITPELQEYLNKIPDAFHEDIIVAHPDTGYMLHPDVVPSVLENLSRNFYKPNREGEPGLSDGSTHGTSTASVIVGEKYGVAHTIAKIVPIRTNNTMVYWSWSNLQKGLDYAINMKECHVISMSLGGLPIFSKAITKLIDQAINKGIIVVAAAGNDTNFVVFPANYDPVIAVAACGPDSRLWPETAFGKAVSVTAPGYGVYRAIMVDNKPTFAPSSGTSYSVAHVAGIAALWMKYQGHKIAPELRQQCFKNLLRNSDLCTPVIDAKDGTYGGGIANAEKLLKHVITDEDKKPLLKAGVARPGLVAVPEDYADEVEQLRHHILDKNGEQVGYVRELELAYRLMSDPNVQKAADEAVSTRVQARAAVNRLTVMREDSRVGSQPIQVKSLQQALLDQPDVSEDFKAAIRAD